MGTKQGVEQVGANRSKKVIKRALRRTNYSTSDKLAITAADMRKAGYTVHAFECDLAKGFTPLATRIKDIGVPDILHNNAVAAPRRMGWIPVRITRRYFDLLVGLHSSRELI